MKKLLVLLMIFSIAYSAYSQPLPDSTQTKYYSAKTDQEKGEVLLEYFKRLPIKDEKTSASILEIKSWFGKKNDEVGKNYTDLYVAKILVYNSNFPAALHLLFSVLPKFETVNDSSGIRITYQIIGGTYMAAKDYVQAAEYIKKEIAFAPKNDRDLLSRIYNGIACAYGEGKMADSGMVYAEKAVKMDTESKNFRQLAVSTSTLGENYIAAGEHDIALPYLRRTALYYSQQGAPSPYMDAYLKNDFAEVFLATNNFDSSNYYSQQALLISIPNGVKDQSMRSYEYLYKSFEQTNQQDSLNKYFRLAMVTKDSLLSLEKIKSIQALTFQEQMRQQEIEAEKLKIEEERKQNIQYVLIALGIIIFITLFMGLSRMMIVNERLISFLAVLGLLIVFEFFNLLIHPWLGHFTHESPVLMLLGLVVLASLLIPLHHRLEHWIKEKMIEKNKAIRLAAAKKTIAALDNKPEGK